MCSNGIILRLFYTTMRVLGSVSVTIAAEVAPSVCDDHLSVENKEDSWKAALEDKMVETKESWTKEDLT